MLYMSAIILLLFFLGHKKNLLVSRDGGGGTRDSEMQYLELCMPEVLFGKEFRKDSKKRDGAVPWSCV